MVTPLRSLSLTHLALTAAVGLGMPACAPRHPIDASVLHDPWHGSGGTTDGVSLPPLHRPSLASSVRTLEISSGSDPWLARAHEFLGRMAAEREHQQAYDGLIEDLDTIRGYMTPGSSSYDATYRWRVFVNPATQAVEGVSATYQIHLNDGRTLTVVDYHTPSERPIGGQLPSDFPACPRTEENFCMVEVSNRTARGYGYYLQQGFQETTFGDHYRHPAGERPEYVVLLIKNHTNGPLPLTDIVGSYATSLGSDVAQRAGEENLRYLQSRRPGNH